MECYLAIKIEWIWVSSDEVDEPRAYYTEWSNSESKKQILSINAYIESLERWYWWTYLQGSNGERCRHREQTYGCGGLGVLGRSGGDEWSGMDGESSMETYTLPYVRRIASGNSLCDSQEFKLGLCDYLEAWDGAAGRFIYIWFIYIWLIHADVWQKPTQHCKAIILQLKIIKKKSM